MEGLVWQPQEASEAPERGESRTSVQPRTEITMRGVCQEGKVEPGE